jgi:hypothetical protein
MTFTERRFGQAHKLILSQPLDVNNRIHIIIKMIKGELNPTAIAAEMN